MGRESQARFEDVTEWVTENRGSSPFLQSIFSKCIEEGRGFTDKQYQAVLKQIEIEEEYEKAGVKPLPPGAKDFHIVGEIDRLEWKNDPYGNHLAVTVLIDGGEYKGNKVWFRAPQALRIGPDLKVGERITLTVNTLSRSNSNRHSGFGRHPKNATVIG